MRIAKSYEYAATVHAVFAVTADQAFQYAKMVATGAISHTATVTESGERVLVMTERVLPSYGLPDFVRTVVGDSFTVVEHQDWGPAGADGSRVAYIDMHVRGAPVTLRGTTRRLPPRLTGGG
jgi:hypothetical protein